MFACLHGNGNLTALGFEFSPVVEQTAPDTVTLDASGLDRLCGLPQDVAAAMARRAAEIRVKVNIALAANPDAAICAARGFAGVSIVPQGDEAKFLGPLPLAWLAPSPELLETPGSWGIRPFRAPRGPWPLFPRGASPGGSAPKDWTARPADGIFRGAGADIRRCLLPFMPRRRRLQGRNPGNFGGYFSWSGVDRSPHPAVRLAVHGGTAAGAGPFSADRKRPVAVAAAVCTLD